ncbi:MAG: twin-arginine translocation signal domain-containing protein, partial [Planctomycetes bacterium]|nr:twin-arginine translocation signal domain-containing protein [Planctomycetota bacterium]
MNTVSRRTFLKSTGAALAGTALTARLSQAAGEAEAKKPFRLNYLLASSLYGNVHVREVVP